ncbi:MAG: DUF2752 domain-containing protein [Tannerella sp.]|jgi:hypothetical protein|nr:DUF2752 domain-containing protein [Tannerella sp.]
MAKITFRTKLAYFIAGVLVLIAGSFIYFSYNPATNVWFPKCPFLLVTGLKCPGCGSQRAIHDLLHFDFHGAFINNALLISSIPYILLLFADYIVRYVRPQSSFHLLIQHPVAIWIYFAFVLVFWVTRNIFGF